MASAHVHPVGCDFLPVSSLGNDWPPVRLRSCALRSISFGLPASNRSSVLAPQAAIGISPTGVHLMKRIITLVLVGTFAAVLAQTAGAQTRPRRVGRTRTPPPQTQQSQPQPKPDDASQASRSGRPPVLSGGNRNPNEQQPASTSTQDSGPEEVGEGDIVRVNTTLVSIPVSVMDRDGKYIPNLRKEDFRIWEDGVEQQVAYFASTEKPFTVALVIDTSGSVRERLH